MRLAVHVTPQDDVTHSPDDVTPLLDDVTPQDDMTHAPDDQDVQMIQVNLQEVSRIPHICFI